MSRTRLLVSACLLASFPVWTGVRALENRAAGQPPPYCVPDDFPGVSCHTAAGDITVAQSLTALGGDAMFCPPQADCAWRMEFWVENRSASVAEVCLVDLSCGHADPCLTVQDPSMDLHKLHIVHASCGMRCKDAVELRDSSGQVLASCSFSVHCEDCL